MYPTESYYWFVHYWPDPYWVKAGERLARQRAFVAARMRSLWTAIKARIFRPRAAKMGGLASDEGVGMELLAA